MDRHAATSAGAAAPDPAPAGTNPTLDRLPLHRPALVHRIRAPRGAPEWPARLEEIGFLPGETVCVLAHGLPGHDPLVVRIGDSTFALRRAEAACIAVEEAGGTADAAPGHA
ncbi:FeoA family protein [Piscinibacter sakaiensis]|uniref:Ferrous iron transport protein n=1 Tax=Piscinibacter sakaiensis TaxID=1547922 RepID=A0A0K8P0J1_PISS1|nr:FeoA family protein [Piscinibacter sakaiensis]GAP35680.1 ferrous iron transport protein [Piscinibacter sakaiensis]